MLRALSSVAFAAAFIGCSDANFAGPNKTGAATATDTGSSTGTGTGTDTGPSIGDNTGTQTDPNLGTSSGTGTGVIGSVGASGSATQLSPTASTAATPSDSVTANVDQTCAAHPSPSGFIFPPVAPEPPSTLPAACQGGIEFNNYISSSFDLKASTPTGSQELTLNADVATYLQPDHIKITAEGPYGQLVILDTCRMRTATFGDPTDGHSRPPDDSIRYFRPVLPLGTQTLHFDWSGAGSPTYIKLSGLCDFSLTPVNADKLAPTLRTH